MKKSMVNYGGILLFYLIIILCIIVINARFAHLNTIDVKPIYAYNN